VWNDQTIFVEDALCWLTERYELPVSASLKDEVQRVRATGGDWHDIRDTRGRDRGKRRPLYDLWKRKGGLLELLNELPVAERNGEDKEDNGEDDNHEAEEDSKLGHNNEEGVDGNEAGDDSENTL
jgi:hypothetical protein